MLDQIEVGLEVMLAYRHHHHHHHLFPSVDPYRIIKSKRIWKSSHFRENKEWNHYKVYINNKAQNNI